MTSTIGVKARYNKLGGQTGTALVTPVPGTTPANTPSTVPLTIVDATTARIAGASDNNNIIEFTNAAAIGYTIRTYANVPLPVGAVLYAIQGSTGQVTFVADTGVTFESPDTFKSRAQESIIGAKQVALNRWELFGDLETALPGVSILGRAANSTGSPAPIVAAADLQFMARRAGVLAFSLIGQSDVTGLVAALALKAPLDSPVFTGNPLVPTPAPGDADFSIANTAFVAAALAAFGSGDSIAFGVTQVAHGFSPGMPIYRNGSVWAQADRDADTTMCDGFVSADSITADTFKLIQAGKMVLTTGQWDARTGDTGGLTAGDYYFLSSTTGGITKTDPIATATGFRQVVLIAIDATTALVCIGEVYPAAVGSGVGTGGAGAGTGTGTMPAGAVIGRALSTSTSYESTALNIPVDDTIPQVSEGKEYTPLTTTYTPKRADSILRVRVVVPLMSVNGLGTPIVAVFRDSVTDATASAFAQTCGTSGYAVNAYLEFEVPAGSIASTTFRVRYGTGAGTTNFMGAASVSYLGDSDVARLLVEEISTVAVALGSGGSSAYTQSDPVFANVSSLLHFNGADGSTAITDQVAGNAWVTSGTAAIRTAQSVFGGSSLLVPSGSCIKCPTNSKFDVGSGDWTIRWRWKYNGAQDTYPRLFQTRDGDIYCGIGIYVDANGAFTIGLSSSGGAFDVLNGSYLGGSDIVGWVDMMLCRNGASILATTNGYLTANLSINKSASLYYNAADTIVIGGQSSGRAMNAYIDEFQFVKGTAVLKASTVYTVPAAAFPNS